MLKAAWKLDNKRYSNIGSKITNMLEFTLQSIARNFRASQGLWNTPSQVMCCNRKFNMLNILVPILEYLSCLVSNFKRFSPLWNVIQNCPLDISNHYRCDEHHRKIWKHSIVSYSQLATLLQFWRRYLQWAAMCLEPESLYHRDDALLYIT